jgi:hypothetical protein
VSARSGRQVPLTGDGDRSRRRCAGRGGRLPAGVGRRWAGCPHPPRLERRAPSSRPSRDDRGRTAATAVSAMMARPSVPPDVSGVDQTRCRGPEHRSRAMRSGPTRSGICRVGPDRTRRASAREPAACRSQSGAVCDLQARAPMASSPLPPTVPAGHAWSSYALRLRVETDLSRHRLHSAAKPAGLLRELAHQLSPP